jgi:hypothetical protein
MKDMNAITFDLPNDHVQALDKLAAGRKVRFSGKVMNGKLIVDNIGFAEKEFNQAVFTPVNAPFTHA